jgi:anion-transporting  ArsA/GET3 family ATPase
MQMLIFTGPAGATAIAAAATAASAGVRTLLAGVGPSHAVAALTGVAPGPEPRSLAPELDLWLLDPLADLSSIWAALPGVSQRVAGDELPVIPGSDLFLAVNRLRSFADRYELVCVDAGPPDALLRALAVPDTFRWMVRLLLGLDRGPGRSSASVARALIPTGLIPFPMEWTGNLQDARARLEQLRDETVAPPATRVRYLLRPDPAGLDEARVTIAGLQLFGLAVECMIAGPLYDNALRAHGAAAMLDEQEQIVAAAATIWPMLPLRRLPASVTPKGLEALAAHGRAIYAGSSPLLDAAPIVPPVRLAGPPDPQVALDLPGLPREALGLTLSGDELIVRVGPYRRHILLPDGLRAVSAIKASKQGDTLTVRPRV